MKPNIWIETFPRNLCWEIKKNPPQRQIRARIQLIVIFSKLKNKKLIKKIRREKPFMNQFLNMTQI